MDNIFFVGCVAGIDVIDDKIEIKFVPKPNELDFKVIIDKLIEKRG